MICGPPKPNMGESNAFAAVKVAKPSPGKRAVFYASRSRFLMIWRLNPLTRRPDLIVPEHGCAFELQNHRQYGVTSFGAKGVREKNLMVRNNISL